MTRHQRGAIAVLTAVSMPAMFGVLALSVDVSYALSEKNIMQGVADNAARAGVQVNSQTGANKQMVIAEVCGIAKSHGYFDSDIDKCKPYGHTAKNVDIDVKLATDIGGISGNYPMSSFAVEVAIRKPASEFFGSLGSVVARMGVRGVADYSFLPCLAALNQSCGSGSSCPGGSSSSDDTGIVLSGNNTNLTALCPVYSNRNNSLWGVKTDGGTASLTASVVYMVGNAVGQNLSGELKPNQAPYQNPFEPIVSTLSVPTGTPTKNLASCTLQSGEVRLSEGYYAGGMKFGNNFFTGTCAGATKVVMQPGTYYLGDDFNINSPVPIEATGVTFVLLGNSDFIMKGGSISITPQETGSRYDGMSVVGNGTGTGSGIWSSSSSINIRGNVVLPKKTFTMSGNVGTGNANDPENCMTVIASAINLSGMSGTLSGGCPTVNGNPNTVRAAGLIF